MNSRNPRPPLRRAGSTTSLYLTICLALGACVSAPPAPPPEPVPEPAPSTPPAPATDRFALYGLLDQAEAALAADHLTSPAKGSAFALYNQVLALDPGNDEAVRGFERIVERYIALALRALERERYPSARSMLARAKLIDPEHPSIEPTAAQIRLLATAKRTKLEVDTSLDDDGLARQLAGFAPRDDLASCRFVIWARNDAQGRRIYQALKNGRGDSRLRAQIVIRTPVSIEKQCFPS